MALRFGFFLCALLPVALGASRGLFTGPLRDALQVRWDINPLNSYFNMPRTSAAAEKDGWVRLTTGEDCTNGGTYNGFRYISKSGDQSLILMYDVKGVIAGVQMNILKSEVEVANNPYKFNEISMFTSGKINGKDVFTTTAYFYEPSKICTEGRTEADLKKNGTATGLFFQDGATPATTIAVPLTRAAANAEGWSMNNCFVGMGRHNFYKSETFGESNCTVIRPAFLLFNSNDQLIGFGLTATGHATSIDSRFEHPPARAIKMIVGNDVAQCMLDQAETPGLTTMHVYFTDYNMITLNCIKDIIG